MRLAATDTYAPSRLARCSFPRRTYSPRGPYKTCRGHDGENHAGGQGDPAMTTKTYWGGHRTKTSRALVIKEYGQTCWLCGHWINLEDMSVDHVIPRSKGGSITDLDNLRPAHSECNKRRGNRNPSKLRAPRVVNAKIPKPSREW